MTCHPRPHFCLTGLLMRMMGASWQLEAFRTRVESPWDAPPAVNCSRGISAALLLVSLPLPWYCNALPNQDRRMRIRVVLLRWMAISAMGCPKPSELPNRPCFIMAGWIYWVAVSLAVVMAEVLAVMPLPAVRAVRAPSRDLASDRSGLAHRPK